MPPPSIHLIEKLSTKETEALTSLLRLPHSHLPTQPWLSSQATQTPLLPSTLQNPTSALHRLGLSLHLGPSRATLCTSHKNLSPFLIRRIFLQITAECTTRLKHLLKNPFLDTEVGQHVTRLQTLNGLWMSPELFRVTVQVSPREQRQCRVPGDCEACILATVGGNPRVLCDLRAAMVGRKKKGGKEPRLLRLVEAWMRWTGCGERIMKDSEVLGRKVRACRRDMQLARRQTRRNREEGIPAVDPGMFFETRYSDASTVVAEDESKVVFELGGNVFEEEDDEDTINDITSHYIDGIRSSASIFNHPVRGDDIHPAYRRSTTFRRQSSDTPGPETESAPSISTSYASITTIRPRLSTGTLSQFDGDLSPRTERPHNHSKSMDNIPNARLSRASAQVPPLRPRQEPAYTESVYSRDIFGRSAEDAKSSKTSAATVNASGLDAAVQASTYEELLRRQEEDPLMGENDRHIWMDEEEEVEVPPIPMRSERRETTWSQFARCARDQAPRRSR